jgi:L-ascorbate metabolism protein UlaG (beta-lactamase superfamily)
MRPRSCVRQYGGRVDTPPRITWMGHATVLVELGGVRLLTDPVLRSRIMHLRRHGAAPPTPVGIDAVLLSHLHYDHLDLPSLRLLDRGTRVLCPAGAGSFLRRAGFAAEELSPGDRTEVRGVRVEATPARHDGSRRPFGPKGEAIGFRAEGVYFAGDTDLFPGMGELAPVDLALLPVAGWAPRLGPGHLDAERAARAAALLRPRVAVPIHWGTLYPGGRRRGAWFRDPPQRFAAQVAELAPEVAVRVLSPGESLEL